jgi:hypothetical protein
MTTQDMRLALAITLWQIFSSGPKPIRVCCFRPELAVLIMRALELNCLWLVATVVHLGSRSIRTGGDSGSVSIRGLASGGELAGERFAQEWVDSAVAAMETQKRPCSKLG